MFDFTITQLAERLDVTPRHARELVRSQRIAGRQLASGAWLVDPSDVARYLVNAPEGAGRSLNTATAWGLLWELSGLSAAWLSDSTRARVGRRIRNDNAALIVRSVAHRAQAHRFAASTITHAWEGLIKTGRAAALATESGLIADSSRLSGYVISGSVEDFAIEHHLVPRVNGPHVICANTLPIPFRDDVMPSAVVAADLACSTDSRERSAGLAVIEELRQRWLAKP